MNKLIDTLVFFSLEGSLILLSLLSFLTLIGAKEDDDKTQSRLLKMIYVQQTDTTYDSVNFDDPISNLSYFKKLVLSFALTISSEEVDQYFNNLMMQIIKTKTMKNSKKSAEVQAQHIMRSAAEKIHDALQELNQDSIVTTAEFVMLVILEALGSLVDLSYDSDDDDDVSKLFRIRNHIEKDAGVSTDYEVLG